MKDKYKIYIIIGIIRTYKIELLYCWESYVLASLVEVVNFAILFKIQFPRKVGIFLSWDSFCGVCGALSI